MIYKLKPSWLVAAVGSLLMPVSAMASASVSTGASTAPSDDGAAARERAMAMDRLVAAKTTEMAESSDWVPAGAKVELERQPRQWTVSTTIPAVGQPSRYQAPAQKAPGAAKYGAMFSKDITRSGDPDYFPLQLTSTGGKDSVHNVYGLGTAVSIEINASKGTVSIPAQQIYQHKTYGPVFICPVNISNGSMSYDKNGSVAGTIDANGKITLSSWGVFVVEGNSAGGAFAIYTGSTWMPSNATLKLTLTDNTTKSFYSCIEQNSPNDLTIHNFAGTGAAARATLTSSGDVKVAPQFMISLANYGDFYCYAADWEAKKINMSTPIVGHGTSNTIVFNDWVLATHRSGANVGLSVLRSVVAFTDPEESIQYPDAPAAFQGAGTQSSPWIIKTAADLTALSQRVGAGETFKDKFFRLDADIDMTPLADAFYPIGDLTNPFGGTFDGNNHKISNFRLNALALGNAGLFGYTAEGSSVKNLTLENVALKGKGSYLGAVCGTNYGSIDNCHVSGSFSGESLFSGGITGAAWGPVSDCTFTGSMTTIAIAGGITGTDFSEIRNCHVDANLVITGALDSYYHDIAGIAGVSVPGKDRTQIIADCSFSGSLTDTGGYGYMAGIVCKAQNSKIERCANTATINGIRVNRDNDVYAGGIIAWSNKSTVKDCLNSGTIVKSGLTSQGNGGIIGYASIGYLIMQNPVRPTDLSYATNCYNTGQIVSAYRENRKGIWGFTYFKDEVPDPIDDCFTNCYNDYQATGLRHDQFNITTAELASGTLPEGFSSDAWKLEAGRYPVLKSMPAKAAAIAGANLLLAGTETTNKVKHAMTARGDASVKWQIYSGDSYAQESTGLRINGSSIEIKDTYSTEIISASVDASHSKLYRVSVIPDLFEGEGTAELPYLIRNAEDFKNLDKAISRYNQTHEGDMFVMTSDVDFTGVEDFKGVALSGSTGFGGIFDGNGHTVKGLKIHTAAFDADGNALSSGTKYGGLFSKVTETGVIRNLSTRDCDFIFHEYGGAIVGSCVGRIENCRNYSDVRGVSHNIGGIAGQLAGGTISRCYNAGSVITGGYCAGGIVAENIGRVEFSQNDGYVAAERYSTLWPKLNQYRVGGIAGLSRGEIEGCVNQGTVRCLKDVGGIVGENTKSGGKMTGNVINCLSTGPVDCTGEFDTRGAIVGKLGTCDEIRGNVYDLSVITYGGVQNSSAVGATPVATDKLTVASLPESLPDSLYVAAAGAYPVLKDFAAETASAAMRRAYPCFSGNATRINTGVSLGLSQAEGLAWSLRKADRFSISGSSLTAALKEGDRFATDTLTATMAAGCMKEFAVQHIAKVFEGEGTAQTPYLIRNNADFNLLAEIMGATSADFRGEFFRLEADLKFADGEASQVGAGLNRLQADFDGNGKTISYRMADTEQKTGKGLGLFGSLGEAGRIHDLTVEAALSGYSEAGGLAANVFGVVSGCKMKGSVETAANYAGAFAATLAGGARIENCRNEASVKSGASHAAGFAALAQAGSLISGCENAGAISATGSGAAGIAGSLKGRVEDCTNSGQLTARSYFGGIAGGMDVTGQIARCVNTADLISPTSGYVGGIAGNSTTKATSASIEDCVNKGNISAATFAGGIISQARSGIRIEGCSNSGDISAAGNGVGGVAGKTDSDATFKTVIAGCSNSGKVSGQGQYAGGIVGQLAANSSIDDSFNTGDVSNVKGATTEKAYLTGGIAGICSGNISRSWSSGNVSCDGYGVGGAIGYLSGGSIDRCFSVGNVKAGNMDTPAGYGAAGGFVGYIGGSAPISNSYCTGDVEAPDNLGGFAATVFTGAKMTNVYTLSKVTATAAAPKTVSNVCSYANDKATDANTTMSNVYYVEGRNAVASAPDARAKALTETAMFSAQLGDAFFNCRGAFPTLNGITDNSVGHLHAVSYEFTNDGDTADNLHGGLIIAPFDDINWTASDNFSIIGSHVYTVKTGDGWLAASLPDGSSERKFLFTVKELSGVDTSFTDSEVVGREWIASDGTVVSQPQRGAVYILRTRHADGTVKTEKVIVR